jgi:hypothetical protein
VKTLLLLAAFVALPAWAQGDERSSYAGISMGSSSQGGVCQTDEETRCTGMMLLRLFGGHQFNRHFALEGAAVAAERTGSGFIELGAVALAPLDEHFALYGRIGGAFGDQSSSALTLAAGMRIQVSEQVGVRLEWQSYHGSESIDSLSAGVFVRF